MSAGSTSKGMWALRSSSRRRGEAEASTSMRTLYGGSADSAEECIDAALILALRFSRSIICYATY